MTLTVIEENYITKRPDTIHHDLRFRLEVAAESPISNGILNFIYRQGQVVGWTEKKITPGCYTKGTTELFVLLCHHNEYLAQNGCLDVDVNPRNFSDEKQWFDKDGIRMIDEIDVTMVCQYFVGMALYYDVRLIEKVMPLIAPVLLTRDQQKISEVFRLVRLKLVDFDANHLSDI